MAQHISDWLDHPETERVYQLDPGEMVVNGEYIETLEASLEDLVFMLLKKQFNLSNYSQLSDALGQVHEIQSLVTLMKGSATCAKTAIKN